MRWANMSIEYSVLIKEKKITEAILIKKLQLMGYSCNMIEKLSKGINIDLNEAIGFSVLFNWCGQLSL